MVTASCRRAQVQLNETKLLNLNIQGIVSGDAGSRFRYKLHFGETDVDNARTLRSFVFLFATGNVGYDI